MLLFVCKKEIPKIFNLKFKKNNIINANSIKIKINRELDSALSINFLSSKLEIVKL
jgi:hypothetical protein